MFRQIDNPDALTAGLGNRARKAEQVFPGSEPRDRLFQSVNKPTDAATLGAATRTTQSPSSQETSVGLGSREGAAVRPVIKSPWEEPLSGPALLYAQKFTKALESKQIGMDQDQQKQPTESNT